MTPDTRPQGQTVGDAISGIAKGITAIFLWGALAIAGVIGYSALSGMYEANKPYMKEREACYLVETRPSKHDICRRRHPSPAEIAKKKADNAAKADYIKRHGLKESATPCLDAILDGRSTELIDLACRPKAPKVVTAPIRGAAVTCDFKSGTVRVAESPEICRSWNGTPRENKLPPPFQRPMEIILIVSIPALLLAMYLSRDVNK